MTTQKKITAAFMVFTAFCGGMEITRMRWSLSPSFIFLIWNLILAWVPYVLSLMFMEFDLKKSKVMPLGILALWVLFLPNGPYIITDLLHLRQRVMIPMWYDVMLVSTFAWVGLLLTLVSVRNVHSKLQAHFSSPTLWFGLVVLFMSSGYGIYVGRFLRWNSWDIFFRPIYLMRRSLTELIHPFQHPMPIQVTATICVMLCLSYSVFYLISHKANYHETI
ncbi:MAG: hypothetical protein JWO03_1885 [Bacteroidetes bacterium]|nr:hypothetical protein [Bacteroidota bacterium]